LQTLDLSFKIAGSGRVGVKLAQAICQLLQFAYVSLSGGSELSLLHKKLFTCSYFVLYFEE